MPCIHVVLLDQIHALGSREVKSNRGLQTTMNNHGHATLTAHSLSRTTAAIEVANLSRNKRVQVYTPSGVQIGLPGVGEGKLLLTFPARYLVGDAINGKHWVRKATEDEITKEEEEDLLCSQSPGEAKWWRLAELQPQALIHTNGEIAYNDQPMGLTGNTMTACSTILQTTTYENVPPADDLVDNISTPPTPPHMSRHELWVQYYTANHDI